MIRTIADVSLTVFVWWLMMKSVWKVVNGELAARRRKRYNPRVELQPGLSSDVYVAKCPHCNIAWPVLSKDDPKFLNHPKALGPYETVDCEGSGKLCEGKLWNNEQYPYREAIAEARRQGADAVCGPLEGEPKVLFPPPTAPSCLCEAFWSGAKSDYLNPSESRQHWQSACELFYASQWATTKLTRCPKCGKEGESNRDDTELTCPHCGHAWTVAT